MSDHSLTYQVIKEQIVFSEQEKEEMYNDEILCFFLESRRKPRDLPSIPAKLGNFLGPVVEELKIADQTKIDP